MRKWVRRAAIALVVCLLGLIALSEGCYQYELHHIEGRPFATAELPPEVFLTAARFTEGADSLEPCPALRFGKVFEVALLGIETFISSRPVRRPCGYFEEGISGGFLARTNQHRARWHLRRIALSTWVARHLSREQALAAWTQYGWFGHGNLQESSAWFFAKPPSALTMGESVTLLIVCRHGGRKLSLEHRDRVLDRMHDEGLLSDAVWTEERARPPPEKSR